MLKDSLLGFILLVACCISFQSKAQLYEFGLHTGYNISSLKLKENKISDAIYLSEGRPFSGGTFGAQVRMSPPRKQPISFFHIIPSLLLEMSLCRCGGNLQMIQTFDDGRRTFSELRYVFYKGDYSAKLVANMKNLQFLIGPTITNRFYTGVKVGNSDELKYAGDQFTPMAIGYEAGIGVRIKNFHLSWRYNGGLTPYGKETDLFPTVYGFRQHRILLHYYFLEKHRGAYWDSIYKKP